MMLFSASTRGGHAVSEPAALSRVIASMHGTPGEHLVPAVRGDLAGDVRLLLIVAGGRVPVGLLHPCSQPTLLIIGGDPGHGHVTPAPACFPQARRLIAWAGATILHAAAGHASHYTTATEAARLVGRALLIETAPDQQDAWHSLILAETQRRKRAGRRLPTLVISPRPPAFAEAGA